VRCSASKAALLSECAYAFRDSVAWTEDRGRSAVNGDRFHQAIAPYVENETRHVETGRSLKWLDDRLEHAYAWCDGNRVPGWRAEVAYAYDPITGEGRILGYDIGRAYAEHGKLAHEIAGSADIASFDGITVTVSDWKTGRSIPFTVWSQMEWLSLFAARATGATRAIARVMHVTDYGIHQTVEVYDHRDLLDIARRIRLDIESIADAWPQDGEHCDSLYCPARAGCDLYQLRKRTA
jgi:hypothetical protein